MAKRHITVAFLLLALPLLAQTNNNDDSCELAVAPAATLLLPYFAVDIEAPAGGETTQFTVTNITPLPQIAHVTLWTDWAYPVLSFNIFLTGYDVQTINLYDVLVRGVVAPPRGTSSWDVEVSPNGSGRLLPASNTANVNLDAAAIATDGVCASLPGELSPAVAAEIRQVLTVGLAPSDCDRTLVGNVHHWASGYATIDVVNTCSSKMPDDPEYLERELLFDNVLIGDYQQIDGDPTSGNYAQASPMVHIRAIPEGGPAGSNPGTNLPYTFYDRYTIGLAGLPRTFDRRQPLPAVFAARWIAGGATAYNTNYKIWREGLSTGRQSCNAAEVNGEMPIVELVKFDEHENSFGFPPGLGCTCLPHVPRAAAAGLYEAAGSIFPANTNSQLGGWLYLNLNNGGSAEYSAAGSSTFAPAGSGTVVRPSQNWVVISMSAQGRYSIDFHATAMGNGCSPARAPATVIAPSGNSNP